ncbi:MAG: CYTH domain-containing protein [Rhodothermales bacterium]
MPTEIELKYAVSAGSVEALRQAERIGGFLLGPGDDIQVHDVYADTVDRAIASAGFAFRIRHRGSERLVCLKSIGRGEGVAHSREEYECSIGLADSAVDWPEGETRDRFLEITGGRAIRTEVEIHQTRFKRFLSSSQGRVAEVSLDEVSLTAGEGRHTFFELELEVLSDELLDHLEALHAELMAAYDLQPVETSKFERAMGMVDS